MALDLKVDIQTTDDCGTLVIEDKTGNYTEENLGGWGGLNTEPLKSRVAIDVTVQVYFYQDEELKISGGTFNLDIYENFVNLPLNNSYKKFKLAIPIQDFKENVIPANSINHFDMIEDNLYQIGVRVFDRQDIANEHANKEFVFKNTCTISKLVSKALTSINLQCEDCDDSDLDNVLFAKSLLESIENI